ncbi:MAG TPA: hypothetical protein VIV11_24445 [Kofleriaceae bacterium]
MESIDLEALTNVVGGANASATWADIRRQAAPHCPNTVARYTSMPSTRAQAQRIGNACVAEMGSFKAGFGGGRSKIQAGIDAAFPR